MIKKLRYRIEYAFVLLGGALVRRLSLAQAQALGRLLGRAAFHLGVSRAMARDNIEKALGPGSPAERDALLLRAYAAFGQTMLELVYSPAISREQIAGQFEFEGLEKLIDLRKAGKGIVCMSAHFGNWEWMGTALVQAGIPVSLLIGTQSNPWVDRDFIRLRDEKGMKMIRLSAVREGLRELKRTGMVALLGDQDGDKWGVFVPFFGRPASTYGIGELLARGSGAAIAFGVAARQPSGKSRMTVHILDAPPEGLSPIQTTAWVLAEYNRLLEAAIRQHPDQWLWMHHRWQSQPWQRVSGEDRRRVLAGEIQFDMQAQQWRDSASGEAVTLAEWH